MHFRVIDPSLHAYLQVHVMLPGRIKQHVDVDTTKTTVWGLKTRISGLEPCASLHAIVPFNVTVAPFGCSCFVVTSVPAAANVRRSHFRFAGAIDRQCMRLTFHGRELSDNDAWIFRYGIHLTDVVDVEIVAKGLAGSTPDNTVQHLGEQVACMTFC